MHNSPETAQLNQIFNELDTNKQGYLNQDQFQDYLSKQPRNIPHYLIAQLFQQLPDQRMDQKSFVFYMMGYRMNLEFFAVARFAMHKNLAVHATASPPSGANQIRKNSLKFTVASKNTISQGQKHKLSFSIGRDNKSQSQKFQQIHQILGHQPQDILGIIKFRVTGAHQQIRQGLEAVIETARAILAEMDEQLFRIIQLFKISIKTSGDYIYIIIEVSHVFLIQFVDFINEIIQSMSPDGAIVFSALIQSNYFKDFLKEGSEKKIEDLQVDFGLNVDNESMKKLKQIISAQNLFNQQNQPLGILMLLFKQINFEASFSNSQKLFNHLGLGSGIAESKSQIHALKDMQLKQTLEGFVPQSGELLQNLKNHAKGEGQISINLKNLFLSLQFNVQVEGLLDLI